MVHCGIRARTEIRQSFEFHFQELKTWLILQFSNIESVDSDSAEKLKGKLLFFY